MYVFDFVCFTPTKSQTIMPKSLTCGYSISVADISVVGYHTVPTHLLISEHNAPAVIPI